MHTLIRNVITLSISFTADYYKSFDYLADPMNQKEWAIHFVLDMETTEEGHLATLPFGKVPFSIQSDRKTGVLDLYIGEGRPIRTRLIEIDEGFCTYIFTLPQPKEMPDVVWENEGLPNLKEEMELLKLILEAL